jgi:hypothetical protein
MVSASYEKGVTEYGSWRHSLREITPQSNRHGAAELRSHGHHTDLPASSDKGFILHPCLVDVGSMSCCRHAAVEAWLMRALVPLQSGTARLASWKEDRVTVMVSMRNCYGVRK